MATFGQPQCLNISPGRLAWSEGRRQSGAGLRTSDEPGELSKWLSRDDRTINIVICISIIIIMAEDNQYWSTAQHQIVMHLQLLRTAVVGAYYGNQIISKMVTHTQDIPG